jgi:hypothetical protein
MPMTLHWHCRGDALELTGTAAAKPCNCRLPYKRSSTLRRQIAASGRRMPSLTSTFP